MQYEILNIDKDLRAVDVRYENGFILRQILPTPLPSFAQLETMIEQNAPVKVDPTTDDWTELDGKLGHTGEIVQPEAAPVPVPPEALPEDERLKAYTFQKRNSFRNAGTTWNGWPVDTDKDAQNNYNSELNAISLGVRSDGEYWGFQDSVPRPLTNQEMQDLATTARLHVKDAFDRYWQVIGGIDGGTITTTAEIDAVFS